MHETQYYEFFPFLQVKVVCWAFIPREEIKRSLSVKKLSFYATCRGAKSAYILNFNQCSSIYLRNDKRQTNTRRIEFLNTILY